MPYSLRKPEMAMMTAKLEDYVTFGPITAIRYISTTISMFPRANLPKVSKCRSRHVFLYRKHKHIDHQETWWLLELPAILGKKVQYRYTELSAACVWQAPKENHCVQFARCDWFLTLAMMSEQETLDRFL